MAKLFAEFRDRPLGSKAALMFVYGLTTFLAVYVVGMVIFDNSIIFRIFEFLWFVHIVILSNLLQRNQRELLLLAILALSPGIARNLLDVLALR